MTTKEKWDVSLLQKSPIINQLKSFTDGFSNFEKWPTLLEYQNIFDENNLDIKPVAQSTSVNCFEDQYEPRVYLKKELQTRTHNWHDFFNALIWLTFPETKKLLNKIHYNQAKSRSKGSNRSTLENRITQFDECGAVIISNNKKVLELIENHQWQTLFLTYRKEFEDNIRCIIFGHAIFEKALKPYIGMTCHCILIDDSDLLEDVKSSNFKNLDHKLVDILSSIPEKPKEKFKPFPILGIPGYWSEQNQLFYSNQQYFR